MAPEEWRLHHAKKSEAPASNRGNKLLGSLSFGDLALMQPFLERVVLKFRYRLQMANRAMKMVYFPESGMISVVAVTGGGRNQTQVGLIGREGMTRSDSDRDDAHSTFRSRSMAKDSASRPKS